MNRPAAAQQRDSEFVPALWYAQAMDIQNVQAIVGAGVTSLVVVLVYFAGRHRDNKERFTADRRTAYSDLVSGLLVLRAVVVGDEPTDAKKRAEALRSLAPLADGVGFEDTLKLTTDIHLGLAARTRDRSDRARDRVEAAFGVILMVAPPDVQSQAHKAMELPIQDFCGERGQRELLELIRVMRADLEVDSSRPSAPGGAAGAMTWSGQSFVSSPNTKAGTRRARDM